MSTYLTTPELIPSQVYNEGDIGTPEVAPLIAFGTGSPEGVVVAPKGSFYTNTSNGALYAKTSGAGNTGWVAVTAAAPVAGPGNYSGVGTPEAAQAALVGSVYTDLTDTDVPVLFLKTTGTGDTGWVQYPAP